MPYAKVDLFIFAMSMKGVLDTFIFALLLNMHDTYTWWFHMTLKRQEWMKYFFSVIIIILQISTRRLFPARLAHAATSRPNLPSLQSSDFRCLTLPNRRKLVEFLIVASGALINFQPGVLGSTDVLQLINFLLVVYFSYVICW